eukprot:2580589-Amphidinium_carterae.1
MATDRQKAVGYRSRDSPGLVGKTGLESEADYEETSYLRGLGASEVLFVGRLLQYGGLRQHCTSGGA